MRTEKAMEAPMAASWPRNLTSGFMSTRSSMSPTTVITEPPTRMALTVSPQGASRTMLTVTAR